MELTTQLTLTYTLEDNTESPYLDETTTAQEEGEWRTEVICFTENATAEAEESTAEGNKTYEEYSGYSSLSFTEPYQGKRFFSQSSNPMTDI